MSRLASVELATTGTSGAKPHEQLFRRLGLDAAFFSLQIEIFHRRRLLSRTGLHKVANGIDRTPFLKPKVAGSNPAGVATLKNCCLLAATCEPLCPARSACCTRTIDVSIICTAASCVAASAFIIPPHTPARRQERSDCSKSYMAHSSLADRAAARRTAASKRCRRGHGSRSPAVRRAACSAARSDGGPFMVGEFIAHDSKLPVLKLESGL